jgi:predicted O-linked N-acetylglucosamine transferase (SPINDLY family)
MSEMGQNKDAIESCNKAIAINANYAVAYFNRGNAENNLKQQQAAIESYSKAIEISPSYGDAYYNRGNVHRDMQQFEAALKDYDKALSIKPDYDFLLGHKLHYKMKICDWVDIENQVSDLRVKIKQKRKATTVLTLLALEDEPIYHRLAAETWVDGTNPENHLLGTIDKKPKEPRIRIGYYSSEFHNHATTYLIAGLFEHHEKSKFELIAFSFGPVRNDEMRKRVVAAFDQFLDVADLSDIEVAGLSRRMAIDIAVDLKGLTQDCRAGIFSYRAAPIQISYLGFPGTMGAPYIDYLIADKTLIPQQSQQYYAEKIAYLPNSYQVNDSRRKISNRIFTREELKLPQSAFVYCCFNNSYKITPHTFDGWMRILKQVQGSVLWLIEDNPSAVANLQLEAQRRGVNKDRLIFAQKIPLPEHLARHQAADLFLDTLPYNAHTTASDSLWAGLPVLTCSGESFASRVAASLLTALNLPELVAPSQPDYETLAVDLAINPERLRMIKQKLKQNLQSTSLFNTSMFARHIENAFTQMYDRYHDNLPFDHIFVTDQSQSPSNIQNFK